MDNEYRAKAEELLKFIQAHRVDVDTIASYMMQQTHLEDDRTQSSTQSANEIIEYLTSRSSDLRDVLLTLALAYSGVLESFAIIVGPEAGRVPRRKQDIDEWIKEKAIAEFDKLLETEGKPH